MSMVFEELDDTRDRMRIEFDAEQASGAPYISAGLSATGVVRFPDLLREAVDSGTEETLRVALLDPSFWNPMESYVRSGVLRERRVNVNQAAERLATTEFNTWYVRGLSGRLIDEGVDLCEVYRASLPKWEAASCTEHEGQVCDVREVYAGHRAHYWPPPGDSSVLSVPFGPGCHHTIRRYA